MWLLFVFVVLLGADGAPRPTLAIGNVPTAAACQRAARELSENAAPPLSVTAFCVSPDGQFLK